MTKNRRNFDIFIFKREGGNFDEYSPVYAALPVSKNKKFISIAIRDMEDNFSELVVAVFTDRDKE